jgi:hypothetical protein
VEHRDRDRQLLAARGAQRHSMSSRSSSISTIRSAVHRGAFAAAA